MSLCVLFMGAPGVGKGTQAARVSQRHGIPHISTGDMLRAAMASGSDLGQQVKAVVDRGDLVGDDLMLELVKDRLREPDARAGFLLDGFPRTVAQAEGLQRALNEDGRALDMVLVLEVPEETVVERLLARGRTDDTRDTVHHRFSVFRDQTEPVICHLEGKVPIARVDGHGSMDQVTERIEGVLGAADQA